MATRQQIFDGSRVQAYAKPLLVALVLHVLCTKVQTLIDLTVGPLSLPERKPLRDGVIAIRNSLAVCVEPDALEFINVLVDQCGRAMQMVRSGTLGGASGRYQQVSVDSIVKMPGNPDLLASGLGETAIAAGILGAGVKRGEWTIKKPASNNASAGTIRIETPLGITKVFLTAAPHTALKLRQEGHVTEADGPIVIQGLNLVPAMPRSPRGAPGRTGRVGVREVSIASLLQASGSFDDLFQLFREELAI